MLRITSSLLGVPVLLALLLASALEFTQGKLGSVNTETFELGLLPLVFAIGLVMLLVFLPLLGLSTRLMRVSWISAGFAGFLSALLPLLVSAWPFVTDTSLRFGFRMERLAESYPWLLLGVVGGLLFWLLALYRNPAIAHQVGLP